MKIVYLEANPGDGGAEEYEFNLAVEARSSGHEVCFVLGEATGALVEKVREANFDLLILPMRSSFNPIKVLLSIIKLRKFIDEYKPDITHTQMLREQSLVIGAKIFGANTKLVRTFHRLDQFNWKMAPLKWLYRSQTDAYIAISEYVKEYLVKNGFRRNVFVIHNGVAEVSVGNRRKGLGYLGRLTPEKGIRQFVVANAKLFGDEAFVIGGDGPELSEITTFVQKKGLKIDLVGRVTDKNKFFNHFNVLVLPSATEALPLVALEAFSSGTPVVAFDLPSLRGLINEGNGILVKPGDYKKLAESARTLSESEKYHSYSVKAHETYLHSFTLAKMWFDTHRVYEKLCQKD